MSHDCKLSTSLPQSPDCRSLLEYLRELSRRPSASPTCNSKFSLRSRFVHPCVLHPSAIIGGTYPTVNPRHSPHGIPPYDYRAMKISKILRHGKSINTAAQGETNLPVRILVVEDDLAIGKLNARALTSSEYRWTPWKTAQPVGRRFRRGVTIF